jgi:hypothetical protein
MARKITAAQSKAARQKKLAIGGSALLAVVMIIQGPKILKLLKGDSAASAAPAAVVPAPVPAVPTSAAPVPVVQAAPSADKLVSFESFKSKDPFIQQVSAESAAAPASNPSSAATSGVSSATKQTTTTATEKPGAFKIASGSSTPAAAQASATIEVNGKTEAVGVGKTFPKQEAVFQLVSVAGNAAQIAIADGSFKSGGKTIALTVGKAVTLLNTADGKRYKLLLVSTAA